MIDGYNFVRARFTNNERTIIEAEFVSEDGTELIPYTIEVDSHDYHKLLELISLDDLHESTYIWIQEQERAFKDYVLRIAKDKGWIFDVDGGLNSNIYEFAVKAIFTSYDPDQHKEQLFLVKMRMFEQEAVKTCKDKTLKGKLRKSKTIQEAFKYALEILESNPQTSYSQSESDTQQENNQQSDPQ